MSQLLVVEFIGKLPFFFYYLTKLFSFVGSTPIDSLEAGLGEALKYKVTNTDYDSFSLERLVDNSVTDFELHLSVDGHLILYSGSGYVWVKEEIESLMSHGYKNFLVRSEDSNKVRMYLSMANLPRIQVNEAPEVRVNSIAEVGGHFTKTLFEGEVTEACVQTAKTIGTAMVDCLEEDHKAIGHLQGLANHDYYTYQHSVRVAMLSVSIAVALGLEERKTLEKIAIGGLFHDIGKKDIPESVINKMGPLTDQEWAMMKAHPEKGIVLVEKSPLSHVSKEIILHHHEKIDGSGYPHGIGRRSLLDEVQVATLADIFDALTSQRAYQKKRTNYEALDFIKHKLAGTKIDQDIFKALIECLKE